MKKNILYSIIIFSLLVIFYGCNNNTPNEPEGLNQLSGTWEEKYHYDYNPWEILYPENEFLNSGNKSLDDTTKNAGTVIKFEEQTVTILTFPQRGYYYIFGNELKRGSFADTMYTGTYTLNKDTIVMKIKGFSDQESIFRKMDKDSTLKFTFQKNNDSLELNVVTPASKDSFAVSLDVSSFLWGYSYNKSSVVFVRR